MSASPKTALVQSQPDGTGILDSGSAAYVCLPVMSCGMRPPTMLAPPPRMMPARPQRSSRSATAITLGSSSHSPRVLMPSRERHWPHISQLLSRVGALHVQHRSPSPAKAFDQSGPVAAAGRGGGVTVGGAPTGTGVGACGTGAGGRCGAATGAAEAAVRLLPAPKVTLLWGPCSLT
eukprot:COSAG01_NODE_1801_length_9200_cov_13.641358_6_plen_177_part_00